MTHIDNTVETIKDASGTSHRINASFFGGVGPDGFVQSTKLTVGGTTYSHPIAPLLVNSNGLALSVPCFDMNDSGEVVMRTLTRPVQFNDNGYLYAKGSQSLTLQWPVTVTAVWKSVGSYDQSSQTDVYNWVIQPSECSISIRGSDASLFDGDDLLPYLRIDNSTGKFRGNFITLDKGTGAISLNAADDSSLAGPSESADESNMDTTVTTVTDQTASVTFDRYVPR